METIGRTSAKVVCQFTCGKIVCFVPGVFGVGSSTALDFDLEFKGVGCRVWGLGFRVWRFQCKIALTPRP